MSYKHNGPHSVHTYRDPMLAKNKREKTKREDERYAALCGDVKITCPACRTPPKPDKCPEECWCTCHKKKDAK